MTGEKDGGSAFPVPSTLRQNEFGDVFGRKSEPGMTLRQYATIEMMKAWRIALTKTDDISVLHSPGEIYELAAADADAMLAEREKADG